MANPNIYNYVYQPQSFTKEMREEVHNYIKDDFSRAFDVIELMKNKAADELISPKTQIQPREELNTIVTPSFGTIDSDCQMMRKANCRPIEDRSFSRFEEDDSESIFEKIRKEITLPKAWGAKKKASEDETKKEEEPIEITASEVIDNEQLEKRITTFEIQASILEDKPMAKAKKQETTAENMPVETNQKAEDQEDNTLASIVISSDICFDDSGECELQEPSLWDSIEINASVIGNENLQNSLGTLAGASITLVGALNIYLSSGGGDDSMSSL